MEIKEVEKLAALSRLELAEDEKIRFQKEIGSILEYVGVIQGLSAKEESGAKETVTLKNIFRDDTHPHESGIYTEEVLQNAPRSDGNYFKVKKIL